MRRKLYILYHFVREANARGIIKIRKIKKDFNLSDGFTKAQPEKLFRDHMDKIFLLVS